MGNSTKKWTSVGRIIAEMSVKEIIHTARGSYTQSAFAELLQTRQSLISKYESGKTNPPSDIINKCIEIIHVEDIENDVSLKELQARIQKVLRGPAHAQARRAFAVILDSLA